MAIHGARKGMASQIVGWVEARPQCAHHTLHSRGAPKPIAVTAQTERAGNLSRPSFELPGALLSGTCTPAPESICVGKAARLSGGEIQYPLKASVLHDVSAPWERHREPDLCIRNERHTEEGGSLSPGQVQGVAKRYAVLVVDII